MIIDTVTVFCSPIFVEIGSFSLTYDQFYQSFKPRGDVNYINMSVHSHIYNDRARFEGLSKPFIKKFMFTPYAAVS